MKYNYSIIIPHFNDSVKLHNLIKSIPERNDIEIIVIDDNSSEILDFSVFSQRNLSLFVNDTGNQSAGACRNIGLRKAEGEWLLFADADDFFLLNAFTAIDKHINNEIDIIYFSPESKCLLTGNTSDRHSELDDLVERFIANEEPAIRYEWQPPWSKVYRRDFLLKNNLEFEEVIAANDVIFSLKSGHLAQRVKACKDKVYCVTRGRNTLTVNRSKKILRSRLLVELRRFDYVNTNSIGIKKPSFVHYIKYYGHVMDLMTLNKLFYYARRGVINFFPSTYSTYLASPTKLYRRIIVKKNIPSHLDKKYHQDK